MSRFSDAIPPPRTGPPPPLPVIDWARIGQRAPAPVTVAYQGPDAPLPRADAVVLTWTTAEWSALDHVFLDSATARRVDTNEFERTWHMYLYSRDVGGDAIHDPTNPLWGFYRLVDVPPAHGSGRATRVLLFKCGAHLAHPPWLRGLSDMVAQILADARPEIVYSIGTAGGTRDDLRLGDVVVTDAAHLLLRKAQNTPSGLSGRSFASKHPLPSGGDVLAGAQAHLFFPLAQAVSYPVLGRLLHRLAGERSDAASLTLTDLVNAPLRPEQLGDPAARPLPGTPLLTTDYYFIASGDDAARYAVLEMDDAVVGAVAEQHDTAYAFVRNVSDPVVPATTAAGAPIADAVRDAWSSLIYDSFGIYSSMNGALATWALLAAG